MRAGARWRSTVAAVALALAPARAGAHAPRGTSYSLWEVRGSEVNVQVKVPLLEVARLAPSVGLISPEDLAAGSAADRSLGAYLTQHIVAEQHGRPCPVVSRPERVPAHAKMIAYDWAVRCPGGESPDRIRVTEFFSFDPRHVHIARIIMTGADGHERSYAGLLSETQPTLSLRPAAEHRAARSLGDFFLLGVRHIATGYDHLAFLAALLLAADSLATVVRAITGFTLGHSLTLGLALGGVVAVDRPASVEALIGLSVAVVAAETLAAGGFGVVLGFLALALAATVGGWLHLSVAALLGVAIFSAAHVRACQRGLFPRTLPWLAAAAFGLIHGLAFAGAMSDVQIEPGALATVLGGFNLGVEAGQLGALAAVLALAALGRPLPERRARWLRPLAAAALVVIGTAWFVARGAA